MSAKGQVIKFHGTGEGFDGDNIVKVRGTATVDDVGVTGKPEWVVDIRIEPSPSDPDGLIVGGVVECGLSELPEILSGMTRSNIELDF